MLSIYLSIYPIYFYFSYMDGVNNQSSYLCIYVSSDCDLDDGLIYVHYSHVSQK
jgi:hypothetical protein